EIADKTGRHVNSVRRDLNILRDAELTQQATNSAGKAIEKDGFPVYEKSPLARTISMKYFEASAKRPRDYKTSKGAGRARAGSKRRKARPIAVPDEKELLNICERGESQIYEFKGQGTNVKKVVKEIAGMLNTIAGGVTIYGVDDDGNVQGAGVSRQKFDQPLQNSLKHNISPAATVALHSVSVLGSEVLVVVVPPWNCRDVYRFDDRVYLRKGTNTFRAESEECQKLYEGEPVI
ncbi:MAG: ATP-binding protein, partial [Planctomycetota bacterium]|nr:ATP-binding protein [Planctomycetota bacterium]